MLFVNDLEVGMSPDEDSLALVIEIRALRDLLKVFRSVFLRPKHLPARSVIYQFLSLSGLERSLVAGRACRLRCDQAAGEFKYSPQRPAVILVISKQEGFNVWCSVCVPGLPPDYALQPGGIYVCALEPKKTPDIFQAIRVGREIDVRMDNR